MVMVMADEVMVMSESDEGKERKRERQNKKSIGYIESCNQLEPHHHNHASMQAHLYLRVCQLLNPTEVYIFNH